MAGANTMKNLKSIEHRTTGGDDESGLDQRTILCSEERMAGCLFHDMLRYYGQSGCRERGCHCPLAGAVTGNTERTH